MPLQKTYRVAEFAELAGVTVRTLQYYDRIGILKPTDKTEGRLFRFDRFSPNWTSALMRRLKRTST